MSFICIFVAILWEALCTYSRKTINMFTYPPFKACLFATLATFRKKIFHHPGWEPVFLPPPSFRSDGTSKKRVPYTALLNLTPLEDEPLVHLQPSPICFKENDLKSESSTSRAFFVNPAVKFFQGCTF